MKTPNRRFVLIQNVGHTKGGFSENFNKSFAEINSFAPIKDEQTVIQIAMQYRNGTSLIPKKDIKLPIGDIKTACSALAEYGVRVLEIMN